VKRAGKSRPGPRSLLDYAQAHPEDSWEQMRDNNAEGGYTAAHDCRDRAIQDQHGLCAYCEQKITTEAPRHRRIEHFHPKADQSGTHNWSLDWENMLAVCDGGGESSTAERKIHPLPANLSCDAHKDREIQAGNLPSNCEGYLLNPLCIPAFPNLLALDKGTGHFRPDYGSCSTVDYPGNAYNTTAELVRRTIAALNLNCERLAVKRRLLVVDIDKNKKTWREKGLPPAALPAALIRRYFKEKWPEFFTTLRCCLGPAAEDHLNSLNYQG